LGFQKKKVPSASQTKSDELSPNFDMEGDALIEKLLIDVLTPRKDRESEKKEKKLDDRTPEELKQVSAAHQCIVHVIREERICRMGRRSGRCMQAINQRPHVCSPLLSTLSRRILCCMHDTRVLYNAD
jgi:hypothetical protein